MQFAKASLALSLVAASGLSGLSAMSPATSEASTRCTAGTYLGRYTLKSNLTNQYIRAGIGSGAYLGAKADRVGGNTSWETFDVYDLGNHNGLNGGTYALLKNFLPRMGITTHFVNLQDPEAIEAAMIDTVGEA